MKEWIYTTMTTEYSGTDHAVPDIGGIHDRKRVQYSLYTEVSDGDEVLVRLTAPDHVMRMVKRLPTTEVWSDREAYDALGREGDAPLEHVDQPDVELDIFAEDLGLDPDDIRRQAQQATRGAHVVQDQEQALIHTLAQELGTAPCSGRCRPGNPCDRCAAVLGGRGDAHATTFAELRSRL